jgi:cytoskeletal protein RodZ
MPTVAEQLRRAREAQGLSVAQLAEVTKIKSDHLRALESGDYEGFTAPVYIRGFVRCYAGVLKLNVPQIITALDVELSQTKKFAAPPSLSGQSGGVVDLLMYQLSKVRWQVVLPIMGAVVVIWLGWWGFRAWRTYRTADPLARLGPGYYQPATGQSADILVVPAPSRGRSR